MQIPACSSHSMPRDEVHGGEAPRMRIKKKRVDDEVVAARRNKEGGLDEGRRQPERRLIER
eukprot:765665-Hanusia_phi.AAC.2